VEADPAVVNLSAFETFFPERRPFFLEGADLFAYNIGDEGSGESLFYSRRIGRAPQRGFIAGAEHVDMPDATTILGAGKLTGRIGAWSIGFFDAVTQAEHARGTARRRDRHVRGRAAHQLRGRPHGRDFRNGGSTVGGMFTATHRDIDDDALRSCARRRTVPASVGSTASAGPAAIR
jgi:hypothetical protein